MRKISGQVVSTKPVTLSRAAEIISRFTAVDNGSSAAVSMYLQRTADAFNQLDKFHDKRTKLRNLRNKEIDGVEKRLDGDEDSENKVEKNEGKSVNNLDETNESKDVEITKKKKREIDLKEKSSKKKKRKNSIDL